ncbi:MAG: hypothetical protein EKK56_07950 [Flavobacteriaceae bacterium]|nr:MAG: hypothetical protein EKK56_07950 [Flavobacteriaceae bacterium]
MTIEITPEQQKIIDDFKKEHADKIFTPEQAKLIDEIKIKHADKIYGSDNFSPLHSDYSKYSYLDRAKQLGEGFAEGVGKIADIYKSYVESPINYAVGTAIEGLGNMTDVNVIKSAGQHFTNAAEYNWQTSDKYANSFKKPFETEGEGEDELKRVLQAAGKGIEEGLEWAIITAATAGINNVVNVVKVTPKGLIPLKAPWLDKINTFLQYGYQGLPKTAAVFGTGRGIEKIAENPDDGELMKFAKGIGSFVVGGITVDKLEKPMVNAIKSTSNTIVDIAGYLYQPTKNNFNKIKKNLPDMKDFTNFISYPIKMSSEKAYNYIISRSNRAVIDEDMIKSFDELGIPKSALTIFTEDYVRPHAVVNRLPSVIYTDYLKNVRKSYIDSLTSEFERSLGKIPIESGDDTIARNLAQEITHNFLEKPDMLVENAKARTAIGKDLNDFSKSNLKPNKAIIETDQKMKEIVNSFEAIKIKNYQVRDNAISKNDFVNPNNIRKVAEELKKEFNIAGSKGTTTGKIFEITSDIFSKLGPILQKNSNITSNFKITPNYIFKLKNTLNEHITSGYITGSPLKILTKLTDTCDKAIEDGILEGTIKNSNLAAYAKIADDFYKNEYINLTKLNIVKSLQNRHAPDWIYNQLNDPNKIKQLEKVFDKNIVKKDEGIDLLNNLKKIKVQDIFTKEFNYLPNTNTNTNTKNYTPINTEGIYNLFSDVQKGLKLRALIGDNTYDKLESNLTTIAKKLDHLERVANNPLFSNGNNIAQNILDKIDNRKGLNELISYIRQDLNYKDSDKLISSLRKLSGYEYLLKDVIKDAQYLKGPNLYSKMINRLEDDDLLISIFNGKKEYNKFLKNLRPVTKKLINIYDSDVSEGGYLTTKEIGGYFGNILQGLKNNAPYAVGGYQIKGIFGAIGAVLGKSWISRSLANIATDEKSVDKLIKAVHHKNDKIFINLMLNSAKNISERIYKTPYLKKYGANSTLNTIDYLDKKNLELNDGYRNHPNALKYLDEYYGN